MSKKHIEWLYNELPNLVSHGVFTAECAERVREYYGDEAGRNRRAYALIICGVVGATLIGLGIILLFAHNWENLSRPARTVLSFTPLVIGQGITGWTLLRRRDSIAWREGSTLFLMAGIGAAIALIGQTYHIPGDLGTFLLTWMLLTVPSVYLLGATAPGVLYWVGLTCWAGYMQGEGSHAVLFWPLAAVMGPHLWKAAKENPYGPRVVLLGWVLALCLCVATGITLEKTWPGLWIVVYCGLFATMYLLGDYAFHAAPSIWQRPLHVVGACGATVLSLVLTFEEPWKSVGWAHYRSGGRFHEWAAIQDYVMVLVLLTVVTTLLVVLVRDRRYESVPFGVAGVVGVLGYVAMSLAEHEGYPTALFNAYLFGLAVVTLVAGIRSGRLATLNGGLLMLTALIVARFFDWDLSFTVRGIAFITIGVGFLGTNLLVRRTGEMS